jgi:CheY-like chemotaxis protein
MSRQVLYVDDDATNTRVLSRLLRVSDTDVELTTCHAAQGARRVIEEDQPDVVLLDYNLPDSDGVALGHEVRQRLPNVRLYLVTALTDRDLADVMREAGGVFDGALRKPLGIEDLAFLGDGD